VTAPPETVLRAFAVADARRVPGRPHVWLAGDAVLKPLDLLPDELDWQAGVLTSVSVERVRLAPPLRTEDGRLVVDGWTAWRRVEGRHEPGRWREAIEAGRRLHRALAGLERPAFLDARTHPWSVGDRAAWGELPLEPWLGIGHVARLAPLLRPVTAASGLIHGDLAGNVLHEPGLPPAVIDLSPYWRPPPFADAIVVADALVWEGADESVLGAVADVEDLGQYLARALIYRLVTEQEARDEAVEQPYDRAVDLAVALLQNQPRAQLRRNRGKRAGETRFPPRR
jgi:uncharacterized protein (TIGR02569 family)